MSRPIKTQLKLCSLTGMLLLILLSSHISFSAIEGATNSDEKTSQNIKDGELHIEADYMKFDLETSSSIYRGNVNITQGTIKLTGDNVTIKRKNNEISDIQIDGKPARYVQDEESDTRVHAVSQHMEYNARTRLLVLTVDASLEQSNHTVESQRIVYDTQNKVILAGKNRTSGQTGDRVNIILTPDKEASKMTGKPEE